MLSSPDCPRLVWSETCKNSIHSLTATFIRHQTISGTHERYFTYIGVASIHRVRRVPKSILDTYLWFLSRCYKINQKTQTLTQRSLKNTTQGYVTHEEKTAEKLKISQISFTHFFMKNKIK